MTRRLQVIEDADGGRLIADKTYDSNAVRECVADAGMEAVIPFNLSKKPIPHDRTLCIMRIRNERCFIKLVHFRRICARLDRLDAASSPSFVSQPH